MAGGSSSSKGKNKAKGPSKTERLNEISRKMASLNTELTQIAADITYLQGQYQLDADGRAAYKKSTHDKLQKLYDKQISKQTKYQEYEARYTAIQAEPESSSDESSHSRGSGSSSGRSKSSKSSATWVGWDCGACGTENFTDPFAGDEDPAFTPFCANNNCQHVYCGDDNHCTIQWQS